jgi:hypothetical protein
MTVHKYDYNAFNKGQRKGYALFDLFKKYGINNFDINLIEKVKCNCKDDLLLRETYHIQKSKCINKVIPLKKK